MEALAPEPPVGDGHEHDGARGEHVHRFLGDVGVDGEPGLLERFTAASTWVRGKRVSVDEGGGYTGVTDGLDSRGFLRVAGDDGVLHTVLSGGVRARK